MNVASAADGVIEAVTSGSARRACPRRSLQEKFCDSSAAIWRIGAVERDRLVEVRDTSAQQTFGEIGKSELGAIRQLQPILACTRGREARELRIGIELLHLDVQRIEVGQEVETRFAVDEEGGIERRE